jgi:diguanylate cyclase (GGDEF)-like protein
MAREIRTAAQVYRRVLTVTVISILGSVAVSQLVMGLAFRADATVTAAGFRLLTWFFSVFVPAVVCPLVCYQSSRLMQQLTLARDELETLARTDQLTGVLNRRGFETAADEALTQARAAERPMAALMLDIDAFKQLNDTFGHAMGDVALKRVAKVLLDCAGGRKAIVGRQGGDEFAMMLPEVDRDGAAAIAQDIRAACAMEAPDGAAVSVSIGIVVSAHSQTPLSMLLRRADIALYEVKREGASRIAAGEASECWPSVA